MATYNGVSAPVRSGGKTVWIEVAQNLNSPDAIMDDVVTAFLYRVGWITIPILLVLLAIDIYIVRRALRPVREASNLARNIGPARIDLRLPTQEMPGEVLPLINAVNQALDRLESGFRAQREFSADAAHELRTPLAVLRARIDLLADKGAARELRTSIVAMSRIVNQLLEIADLESFTVDPNDVADLQNVAAEIVGYIAPVALAQDKDIALTGAPGPVRVKGNAEALFQAIRNVVENAVKHTAPGTTVEVEVGTDGSVKVLDRGPGIAENERELIFRRFWRGDRRHVGSAGLGLSIVARIVEAHAGKVTVGNREGGGAVFSLSFALAASDAPPAMARPPHPAPLPQIAQLPHVARLRR
jgi:signal transduction histidine kinase